MGASPYYFNLLRLKLLPGGPDLTQFILSLQQGKYGPRHELKNQAGSTRQGT